MKDLVRGSVDYFAGAGGWDVAARALGWEVDGIEIMPEARATRDAAGLNTVGDDVRAATATPGQYAMALAGPPCQPFSVAGKGAGRAALEAVLAGVARYAAGVPPTYSQLADSTGDERTALVLEPLRLALEGVPVFLAWEQVPAVLPVWQACAAVLRDAGYSVATGVLCAEQFGVPQTRRRAFLAARRDGGTARLPEPTHSRFHQRTPQKYDHGMLPWVSMADAIGWGMTARPSMTVTGGGTATGGAELFGTGARKGMRREWDAGRWAGKSFGMPSAEQAALLQTFPAGFPFQGGQGKRFMQIGNAVPPMLARAVLEEITREQP